MAYREPGVTVTQEFANALPALATFALPNVTVGPVFQVVKAASAGTYTGASATFAWAGNTAGSIPDTRAAVAGDLLSFPVAASLGSSVVRLASVAATGEVLVTNLLEFTDPTASIFANVLAGDVINIASGPLAGSYTVREKIDNNTLRTNEVFPAAGATLSYTLRRNVGTVAVDMSTATLDVTNGVTIPASISVTLTGWGSVPIIQAAVLLTFRALRLEQSAEMKEYGKISELQADFGIDQIVPESPAVFGAYLALSNAVTKTNLLALPAEALTDEVIAYGKALDILKLEDIYAISVMTQNTAVHTALKAHCEGMSDPLKKLERVGIINRTLVTTEVVVGSITTGGAEGLNVSGLKLTSAASTFITDGVVPGHFVRISAPSLNAGRYAIASVDSQTQLTLATAASVGAVVSVSFLVDRDLTKPEQASVMAAFARSLGSRRMVLTFPDIVKIPVGSSIRSLPGFFLNCAIGALTTGLPTQQGLTNLNVALYSGVEHSTKYFDNDQLNIIADGGVMIFVQDVLNSTPLYIRHQLTTDRSAIKFQEFSVTKNVDFISKFIRTNHRPFIGQYNIVDGTFDDLKTSAKGICSFLAEKTKRQKIGGVIKSGKLASIAQDVSNIDGIVEKYEMDIPIPLNNLDITVRV